MSRVANHQISEIIRTLSLVKNITHTVLSCGGRGQRIFRELHGFQGETEGGVSRHTNEVGGGGREGGDLRNITWPYGGIR